jgi:hypothetical protein
MAIGIIIMGFDFIYGFAVMHFEEVRNVKHDLLVLAYLFHHWRVLYFASEHCHL